MSPDRHRELRKVPCYDTLAPFSEVRMATKPKNYPIKPQGKASGKKITGARKLDKPATIVRNRQPPFRPVGNKSVEP